MKSSHLFYFILFTTYIFSANKPIGLIIKSVHKVNSMINNQKIKNINVNTPVFDNQEFKIKNNSFLKIVYLDDGTQISCFPNSEIIIKGKIDNGKILKSVIVKEGIVKCNTANYSNFLISTELSEVICEESDFWIISNKNLDDTIYNLKGNVTITNKSTLESLEINDINTKIILIKDLDLALSSISVDDRSMLDILMFNAAEISTTLDKIENNAIEDNNVLKIDLKNKLNIKKQIIITYTK